MIIMFGDLKEVFTYHAPDEFQQEKYKLIREAALDFAKILFNNVPDCEDRNVALRKIREAVMTANAAIALGGLV